MLPRRFSKCRLVSLQTSRQKSSTPQQRPIADASNVVRSPFTDVSIPDSSLSEYVWRKADRWRHWPALTCAVTGRSYTYGEARAAAERLSMSLTASAGLHAGDTLALVMPNMPEFPLTLLGATAAGLIVSPANPVYTPEELARQFTDCGARAVVTTPALLDKVRSALDMVPGGAQIVVATDGGAQEAELAPPLLSLHAMLRREVTRRTPRAPRPDLDGVAVLPYSSGTTGLPKGVCISHRSLVANLCQMEHPDVLTPPPAEVQDVALAVLPFFHIYGLNGVMNIGLSVGRHTVTLPRFESSAFAAAFARYKPTVVSAVPPLLSFLATTQEVTREDLARMRFVTCGAAPATRALIEQFVERAGSSRLDFREGYGMTETSCMALFTPRWAELRKVGSCGVPVPLTEIAVVDSNGRALPLGREGELWLRGPQIMQGYHNNKAATAETLTDDGWLRTGDVAFIDEEGFVYIVDRMKELIKVKGLQVSPTELEGVIRTMEGVADVAVAGVADERAGELPRAFVVRKPDCGITEQDVQKFVAERVAPFKRLEAGVKFVKEIPKNAAGKILRKMLKNLEE